MGRYRGPMAAVNPQTLTIMDARMRERNRPPFQARVASVAIITTVAVLVAACVSFMLQQWSVSRQQSRTEQSTLASVVAASVAADLRTHNLGALRVDVGAAGAAKDLVDVRYVDAAGHTGASYTAPPNTPEAELGPIHETVAPVVVAGAPAGKIVLHSHDPTIIALLPRFLALTGALFFGASG